MTPLLDVGAAVQESVHFERLWCERFLRLTGDMNEALHSIQGKQIVQGAAIIAKLGTEVSRYMRNYIVAEIGVLTFKQPVYIDDVIDIMLVRINKRELRATLRKHGGLIAETTITLAPARVLG